LAGVIGLGAVEAGAVRRYHRAAPSTSMSWRWLVTSGAGWGFLHPEEGTGAPVATAVGMVTAAEAVVLADTTVEHTMATTAVSNPRILVARWRFVMGSSEAQSLPEARLSGLLGPASGPVHCWQREDGSRTGWSRACSDPSSVRGLT
jgi:hypothetical protein